MNNSVDIAKLSAKLGSCLRRQQATITTAESCTGGGIAKAITDTDGCSAWFHTGVVTYSEQSKQHLLGVSAQSLQQFGVVSDVVAGEMAQGACLRLGADYAISVTGFAGPGGGSAEVPVGTVCFGFAWASGKRVTYQCHFSGDRQQVRQQSVQFALQTALTTFFKN